MTTSTSATPQVAIVTGAGEGIGRAIARRLASDGYAVVCAELDEAAGVEVAAELVAAHSAAIAVQTDVSNPAAVESMVEATMREYGRIDVLVNNAGRGLAGRAHELSLEQWRLVIDTTLSSVFFGAKYVIPHMIEAGRGRIVNIASVQGFSAHRRAAAYNAAKGGVINLTRSLALDYALDGIRVNCICPGAIAVRSPQQQGETLERRAAAGELRYPQARSLEEAEALHALGRLGTPEEIADAAAFLVSDQSTFLTGAALVVDGGLTIQVLA